MILLEGGRETEIVACKLRQLNSTLSKPASSSDIGPPLTLNTLPAQSIELLPFKASARSGRISIPGLSSAAQTSPGVCEPHYHSPFDPAKRVARVVKVVLSCREEYHIIGGDLWAGSAEKGYNSTTPGAGLLEFGFV